MLHFYFIIMHAFGFGTTPSNIYLSYARIGTKIIKMVFPVLAASVSALSPRFHVKRESPATSFTFWLSTSTNFSSQSREMLKRFLKSFCTTVTILFSWRDCDRTRRNSKTGKSEKQTLGQARKQIKSKCLFFRIELKIHEIDGWQSFIDLQWLTAN